MTFYIVSDVHGAADALAVVAPPGSNLLVLGDLVNLVDYRTLEGIVPDVVGADVVRQVVDLRTEMRFDDASALWAKQAEGRVEEIRQELKPPSLIKLEARSNSQRSTRRRPPHETA